MSPADVAAAGKTEIDAICDYSARTGLSLQESMVQLGWPADGPAPVGRLLALWAIGIVAGHWRQPIHHSDEMGALNLLMEIAGRTWSEDTIQVDSVALSRMLTVRRPGVGAIRTAARCAAAAITRVDGGIALVAHAESVR